MSQKIRFSEFSYDIPENVPFPNPSGYLRRRNNLSKIFAFRTQYSKWYVDRDNPPLALMRKMEQAGCVVDLIDIEESSYDKILQRAHESMTRELRDQQNRCAKALQAADATLAEAEADHTSGVIGWDKLAAARKYHANHRKTTIAKLDQLTKDLQDTAEQFGIAAPKDALATARRRVAGLRSLGSKKAELYAELAQMLKGTPMAAAMEQAEVPALIAADYAEERGHDVSAVRDAFQQRVVAESPPACTTTNGAPSNGVPRYRTDNQALTFSNAHKSFSAEASDLGLNGAPPKIEIESHKTGKVLVFGRSAVINNSDNEVVRVDYTCGDFKLHLIND